LYVGGKIVVHDTNDSSSTTTGALQVAGGAGLGSLYVSGNATVIGTLTAGGIAFSELELPSTANSTSTSTGALRVFGGAGIGKDLYVGGEVKIQLTTGTSSTTTGALQVAGGAGLGSLYVTGSSTLNSSTVLNGSLTMGVNDIISVGTITSSENIITTLTETSSSTTTGALRIAGGAGIGSLYVESLTTLNSSAILNGSLTMGINDIISVGTITSSENIITTLTEGSSSTTTGALRIAGGAGLGSLYVDGLSTLNSATVFNGSLTMGTNNIVSVGSITSSSILSTTATENSTSTTTGVLRIAGGAGLGSLYVANNTIIEGTLLTDVIAKQNTISTGVTFDAGSVVFISDTTDAAALNSGALQVSGGASIAKTLYVQTVIPTNLTMTNNVTLISTDGTLVNNSNTSLVTEQAIKTYVDGKAGGVTFTWVINEQLASGTSGGTFTSGAWQTRALNTITGDTVDTSVTLATNQITMTAGKYSIRARAPAHRVGGHACRLQNITNATTIAYGSTATIPTNSAVQTDSVAQYLFTAATTIVMELQHRCTSTRAGDGYGLANTFGNVEVYSEIVITKL
jgi:hypothetical protein